MVKWWTSGRTRVAVTVVVGLALVLVGGFTVIRKLDRSPLDRGRVLVGDRLDASLPRLRREVEDQLAVVDRHVLSQHRRQTVGLVALGVVLRADAKEAEIEQSHRTREHALAREALLD